MARPWTLFWSQVSREDWSAWNADKDQAMRKSFRWSTIESNWRDEALRTNLWLIPAIESVAAVALFAATLTIDRSLAGPP